MKLCDHCGMPLNIHLGFDHKAGTCLLASNAIDLALRFGPEKARRVIEDFNAWWAEQDSAAFVGEGI